MLERKPRPEEIPPLEAQVAEAEANLAKATTSSNEARHLIATKVVTDEDVIRREQEHHQAAEAQSPHQGPVKLLEAGTWQYDLVAKAAIDQSLAQVEQTKAELDRRTVAALVDGEVLQVNVRPGEFVAAPANQALIVLGDVERLHVRVDIDEHDIHRFLPGAPAVATLRGLPEKRFAAAIRARRAVRGAQEIADRRQHRTRRYPRAASDLPHRAQGQRLYVGQQLDVFIDIE